MAKGARLNDEEKGRIKAYKEEGLSNREIAQRIGRSHDVINKFVRLGNSYGIKKAPGKKPALSARAKRAIRAAAANSTKGTRRLQKEMEPNVSHVTVWKALNESPNLKYEKMNMVPALKKEHQIFRARFGDEHQTWNKEWHSVNSLL